MVAAGSAVAPPVGTGRSCAERFHLRVLRTPPETRRALA